MSTIGIRAARKDPGYLWYKGFVTIKAKRGVEARASGHKDTYLPVHASILVAPKALSTWSS